jgi:hypothetical protein
MACHSPEQSDLAHHAPGTNALNGEGFTFLIPAQEPELAFHHQRDARGKTAVVVKLLAGPQAQGLEGFR